MTWTRTAPSNIALIKYMGKAHTQSNLPGNASLSYTLDHFTTTVTLTQHPTTDSWQAHPHPHPHYPISLSESGKERFIKHLQRIKTHFQCNTFFTVQSWNNFPSDCGLASSASSFAALTEAACAAISEIHSTSVASLAERAELSRQGSGSSCRSLSGPWVKWSGNTISKTPSSWDKLLHQVIIIDDSTKAISSSNAHARIQTSPNFSGRYQRAEDNLMGFLSAMNNDDWQQAYKIARREFTDMHELFHTSEPAFAYLTNDSYDALKIIDDYWTHHHDGPIVTVDAGPNIHLLYRPCQQDIKAELSKQLKIKYRMIE